MKDISLILLTALVSLAFAVIAAIATPYVSPKPASPLAYVGIGFAVLALILGVRVYHSYRSRPFARRFRNESEAYDTIAALLEGVHEHVCVISKAGTSIFFSFQQYCQLLERELKLEVLMVDPEDRSLIELMDKIYADQKEITKRWDHLLAQIRTSLEDLKLNSNITDEAHDRVYAYLDGCGGYRDLILASVTLWKYAQERANANLHGKGIPVSVHGLTIRTYNVLPDIKAWIFDGKACLIGNYDALHLGRDNPIDLYRPSRGNELESWQFENVVSIWEHRKRFSSIR